MSQQRLGTVKASTTVRTSRSVARPLFTTLGAVTLSLFSVACGGSDDGENIEKENPNQQTGDLIGARPCVNKPNSGYPGDELCIEPPPAGKGFQMRYGPKNYDDTAEVAKYLLAPGEETTDCLYMKTPNEQGVFMNQYHARLRPGSHHMITYTMDGNKADSTAPEECGFGLWRFLVGSQEQTIDIRNRDQAPELEKAAMYIAPKLQAAVQVHFVNTSNTETKLKEAWVNAVYAEGDDIDVRVEPIFWIGGLSTVTKARTSQVVKAKCEVPPTMADKPTPADLRMLQLTGHYHSHTTKFEAWHVDKETGTKTRIYASNGYQEPGFTYFNTVTKNPTPEGNDYGGDHSGELFMTVGDRIEWECTVENNDDWDLPFGNAVYKAEMCNMFGTYAPSIGTAWNCFNG
ncbi:MAG TPA: hypothetical protein VI072_09260 [Polyangiaceae bacterium]